MLACWLISFCSFIQWNVFRFRSFYHMHMWIYSVESSAYLYTLYDSYHTLIIIIAYMLRRFVRFSSVIIFSRFIFNSFRVSISTSTCISTLLLIIFRFVFLCLGVSSNRIFFVSDEKKWTTFAQSERMRLTFRIISLISTHHHIRIGVFNRIIYNEKRKRDGEREKEHYFGFGVWYIIFNVHVCIK